MKKRIEIEWDKKKLKIDFGKKEKSIFEMIQVLSIAIYELGKCGYSKESEIFKKMKGGRASE